MKNYYLYGAQPGDRLILGAADGERDVNVVWVGRKYLTIDSPAHVGTRFHLNSGFEDVRKRMPYDRLWWPESA